MVTDCGAAELGVDYNFWPNRGRVDGVVAEPSLPGPLLFTNFVPYPVFR